MIEDNKADLDNIRLAAIALGVKENDDDSLTMTVEQLFTLCCLAVNAAIKQLTGGL